MNNNIYLCLSKASYRLGNYLLEPIQLEHIEDIRIWRNAQMDILRQNTSITKLMQVQYFKDYVWSELKYDKPNKILLSYKYKNELIGYGGLVHNSWENKRSELSFIINPAFIKDNNHYKLIFSNFIKMISEIAFNDLSFLKLFTETYSFRKLQIQTLEACGFIKEGVLIDHVIVDDTQYDSIIHAIYNK